MNVTYVQRGPESANTAKDLVLKLSSDLSLVTYAQIVETTNITQIRTLLSVLQSGGKCVLDFISEDVQDDVGQAVLDLVIDRRPPEGISIHPESELYLIYHIAPPALVPA